MSREELKRFEGYFGFSFFPEMERRERGKTRKLTSSADGNRDSKGLTSGSSKPSIIVLANWLLIAAISSGAGFPVNSRILSNWLRVDFPGKIGSVINISPKIHPTDQMSTPLV